jgi:drug/metabolite transporter (DMT)-like permease
LFSLIAFAANSVLNRLALSEGLIDGGSFTALRILSGALVLSLLVVLTKKPLAPQKNKASWLGACALFTYCAAFSYAYLHLDTAIGALILFGTVQLVIIGASLFNKERTPFATWLGVLAAIAGFVYLMLPSNLNAVRFSPIGLALMVLAGVGWAVYTLLGRKSTTPLADSAKHFSMAVVLCIPFVSALMLFSASLSFTYQGLVLAICSGAITSGLGYAIWYTVLPSLTRLQAGVIQLAVPIVAALGGVLFVNEAISTQFIVATTLILGGVFFTLLPSQKNRT